MIFQQVSWSILVYDAIKTLSRSLSRCYLDAVWMHSKCLLKDSSENLKIVSKSFANGTERTLSNLTLTQRRSISRRTVRFLQLPPVWELNQFFIQSCLDGLAATLRTCKQSERFILKLAVILSSKSKGRLHWSSGTPAIVWYTRRQSEWLINRSRWLDAFDGLVWCGSSSGNFR